MALTTCNSGHQEIVYDDYQNHRRTKCPLCEAIAEKDELISKLQGIQSYEFGHRSAEDEVDHANDYWREQIASTC